MLIAGNISLSITKQIDKYSLVNAYEGIFFRHNIKSIYIKQHA